jgi:hypothetical protein
VERELILNKLLKKYENSKHFLQPNTSRQRVMLGIGKGELPEYDYENAEVRDRFYHAARGLEKEGIVELVCLNDRPIITRIILNLQRLDDAYAAANRTHPVRAAEEFCAMVDTALSVATTPWIASWRDDVSASVRKTLRLPPLCKQGASYVADLLRMLAYYDGLNGADTTVRAFSIACFQNSKRYEQEFQDEFLRIATRFHQELAELSAQGDISVREKQALMGIYSHPELFQLSGKCAIATRTGSIDISPLFPHGIAIPSTIVDDIVSFELRSITRIVFIENLTNFYEYLRTEQVSDELVIYHGGFSSPKKYQFMQELSKSLAFGMTVCFWADIDLGGFQMFDRLQKVFPELRPMRMSAEDVVRYERFGLVRDAPYLQRLRTALARGEFPLFSDAIRMILEYGVTIEQEVFLRVD